MNFHIVKWVPEKESWKILESFGSEEEADNRYDYWSDKFPYAWIEILDPITLVNCHNGSCVLMRSLPY